MTAQLVERVVNNSAPLLRAQQILWYLAHRLTRLDRQTAARYLAQSRVRKLHIGCGRNFLPDWLNTDYLPLCREPLYLDARRRFFFKDDTFDYIFSEHMIEHMSYDHGLRMLSQCRRVLKPLGKIRISTPDLAFLVNLYQPDRSLLQQRYMKWATREFFAEIPEANEVFVINYFMRNWGHTFIYDETTLKAAMTRVGFTNIVKREMRESVDPELCNLENETRLPPGLLQLETVVLEGSNSDNA